MKTKIKPILKWAGGKGQLLDMIIPDIRQNLKKDGTYYEPFIGGGAVLFNLQAKKAVINDFNFELSNVYTTIRDTPENLIEELNKHKNTKEYFYKVRALDRNDEFTKLTNVERAARTIYLNKTCFNGLYRVNQKGQFNVPFANNKNPLINDEKTIIGLSNYFRNNRIEILNGDFETAVQTAKKGDYVYFDPPYVPLSKTASFTSYTKESFDMSDQVRLRNLAKRLKDAEINFMISNSNTEVIHDLYSDKDYFEIKIVEVNRNINSKANLRKGVTEVLITNTK